MTLFCNGMKLSAVISPVLFCIYIDGLLIKLEGLVLSVIWGSVLTGEVRYADDIKLLAPYCIIYIKNWNNT